MYQFENYVANKNALLASMDQTKAKMMEIAQFGISVEEPLRKIEKAKELVQSDKISIVLVGAFSDGKTSVAAGWLNEKMDNMKIADEESSDEILCYEPSSIPEGCQIVDTPGLFGNKVGADENGGEIRLSEKTEKYISEANMVLYVVPAKNPIKESHKPFIRKLMKDMNKLSTTIFVINRMDDVADVTDDDDFALQEKIKTENLRGKLLDCGLTEAEAQAVKVACVSAAPGGKGIEIWKDYREEYVRRSHLPVLENLTNEILQHSREHLLAKTGCDVLNNEIALLLKEIDEATTNISKILVEYKESRERMVKDIGRLRDRCLESRTAIKEELRVLESRKISAFRAATMENYADTMQDEIGTAGDQLGYRLNDDINMIFEKHCRCHAEWTEQLKNSIQAEFDKQDQMMVSALSKGGSWLQKASFIGVDGYKQGIFAGRDLLSKIGPTIKFKPWQVTKMANFASKSLPVIGTAISLVSDLVSNSREQKNMQKFDEIKKELVANIALLFKEIADGLNDDEQYLKNFAPHYSELVDALEKINNNIQEQEQTLIAFDHWKSTVSEISILA